MTELLASSGSLFLGLTFCVAALGKLDNWQGFVTTLGDLGVPHPAVRSVVGVGVVTVEASVPILLWTPTPGAVGSGVALLALSVFSVAIMVGMVRPGRVSCNCLHTGRAPMSWPLLVRNALLMGVSAWLFVASPSELAFGSFGEFVLAVCMAVVAFLLILVLEQVGGFVQSDTLRPILGDS